MMDIFRSVKKSVLGSNTAGHQISGADTVEKLLDRVQSSTLLEDRRDGCRALKALSKKYRLLVGAYGMDTLIQVLESDRNDHEILNYALDTLVNVTSTETFLEEGEDQELEIATIKIGEQFTEIFTKRTENIALIMNLIDEFDFKVRYSSMKLLNNLLQNRPKELQEAILVTPSGMSKIMDLLSDSREVIRNDALLLLIHLTKGNTNLQKIVVFENAFDLLFEIIMEEGFSDGGVVVEDCLILMLNLLKNNPSNQTLFKEGNFIQKITLFFNIPVDDNENGWPAQKVANVHYMLKLVRTLVSPQNPGNVVSSCQKQMKNCGLLEKLCTLLMAVGVPADILTDTIFSVSELIRGCRANQLYFSDVVAPSVPPRPAIVVLLMSMVNDRQPFMLRSSVMYCFQCSLYRNPSSQSWIVQTLLPQTAEVSQITAGQLLCGGLFASDPVSNWFSAIALSHALLDNTTQKEQLLRVQLATGIGSPPVSLLQQCASLLQSGSKILTRLGILQLFCFWVAHCPIAVKHLLSIPGVIPHLTAYLSSNEQDEMEIICQGVCAFLLGLCAHFNDDSVTNFTRESIIRIISDRVGLETFADKVESVLKTEAYSRAAKSPQLNAKHPSDVVFDHEFTKLFKSLEAGIVNAIMPQINGTGELVVPVEVAKYKDIIRDQDAEITRLKKALQENQFFRSECHDGPAKSIDTNDSREDGTLIKDLEKQLTEMTYARDYYYYQMLEKDAQLQSQQQVVNGGAASDKSEEVEVLRKQMDDLQLALRKKDEALLTMTGRGTPATEDSNMARQKSSFEASFGQLLKEKSSLEIRLKESEKSHKLAVEDERKKYLLLQEEMAKLKSEQDDLLVLLSDQETKISHLKDRLRQHGETFLDDEDDDLDDVDLRQDPNLT